MLPRTLNLLSTRVAGDRIVPHYLTESDEPWLRALLDEHARFVGRKRSELEDRMREPLSVPAPRAKLRVAVSVLEGLGRDRTTAAVPPREARWLVFRASSTEPAPRELVLSRVAQSLGIDVGELDAALFADLRGERRIADLPGDLSPSRLALEANRAIVSSFLRRAAAVRITAFGHTRALVRHARLVGLICVLSRAELTPCAAAPLPVGLDVLPDEPPNGVVLEVSGPFALFRHTEVYGRALASLVPRAAWCHRFEMSAACALGRGSQLSTLVVRSGDPIGASRELPAYDSRVEERFAKDFRKAAPEWDVIREPRPVEAAGTLVFPDFELVHRRDPTRRFLLEIVGFWTREYLTDKLRRLREAQLERLVLCIDDKRCCGEQELPLDARVLRYRTRIDPQAVLAVLDRAPRAST